MPIIETTPPHLVDVRGEAVKPTSTGDLVVSIVVTPGASGWPPGEELSAALLELFTVVARAGWVGSVGLQYASAQTLRPDPLDPAENGQAPQ